MSNLDPTESIPLIEDDPWLSPYEYSIRHRMEHYQYQLSQIESGAGSLLDMSRGNEYFGFNRGEQDGQEGVWYREWAPGADALYLVGEFNDWNRR